MSAGHVHTKASLLLTGGFLISTLVTGNWSGLQFCVGSLIGVMVTPDCDVDAGTIHDRYIRNRLGWMGEMFWDGLWYFYRRSLKHGGELSHFPVISTLGRMAYLYLFLIIIPITALSLVFVLDIRYELSWWSDKILMYWKVVAGLMAADTLHYFLDILTKETKTPRQ